MTKIISGFPGIGKSYLFNSQPNLKVLDSDSSKFSWESKGVRNKAFPNNYIQHIKSNMGVADIILVSSHTVVRQALKDEEIEYTVIYPSISLKEEYLDRYKKRGNNDQFIKMIDTNWEVFINEIEDDEFPNKIELKKGKFLKDILESE